MTVLLCSNKFLFSIPKYIVAITMSPHRLLLLPSKFVANRQLDIVVSRLSVQAVTFFVL